MNRIIAILLLLLHINTSMFIPVMDETDVFDAHGMQVDDINSVCEYVDQIVLGHKDDTPEDEDDDQPHYFNVNHIVKEFVTPGIGIPQLRPQPAIVWVAKPDFVLRLENEWTSVVHDIIVPPPKA